ncbi:hypothetical protein LXL04_011545 [Taraxacum kok-saghyz]
MRMCYTTHCPDGCGSRPSFGRSWVRLCWVADYEVHSSFPLPGVSGGRVPSSIRVQSSEAPIWETGLLRMLLLSLRGGIEPGFVGSHDITALGYDMQKIEVCQPDQMLSNRYRLRFILHLQLIIIEIGQVGRQASESRVEERKSDHDPLVKLSLAVL